MAADFSEVTALAIDETSRARGHRGNRLQLQAHGGSPEQIESVSIDMSPVYIKGCGQHLPNARITFDKFHVVLHANTAVDKMRRIEQRSDKSLRGCAGRC